MTNPEISFPSTREKLPVHLPSLPAEQKTPVFNESQSGRQELSNEYLQKVTNNDFLKVDFEKRLQYLTSPKVNFNEVRVWKTQNIRFTFTFDWKFNRELFMKTTAWQVLPPEINEIKVWNTLYTRYWLKWEFFSWNNRLIIKEWTEIEIPKTRTKEEFTEIEKANETSYNEIIKTNPQADTSIIKESISRWIDPKFALLAFWKRYEKVSGNETKPILEDMFTEFDRYRGSFWQSNELKNWKYSENLVLWILAKYNKDSWETDAKAYGIPEIKITDYKSNWERYIALKPDEIENSDSLAEWGYLKWEKLLANKDFSDKLNRVCSNIWAQRDDLVRLMKAESGLDPRIVNSQTKATGLIQFMPDTAVWLWTSVWKIRAMTWVEQLDVVEQYFKKNSAWVDLSNITKLYQVVFYPLSLKKDPAFVFGSEKSERYAQKVASQNRGISDFSQRSDRLIDGQAFASYVENHVSKFSA